MQADHDSVWARCLEELQQELPSRALKNWIDPLQPTELERTDEGVTRITLEAPSSFFVEVVQERFRSHLTSQLATILGGPASLAFEIIPPADDEQQEPVHRRAKPPTSRNRPPRRREYRRPPASSKPAGTDRRSPGWNPGQTEGPKWSYNANLKDEYAFQTFIEGDCNRLARRAALAIADEPKSDNYNPFMVYGGVGLGKTHLVQAIGNRCQERGSLERVLYLSGEQFTTQFVRAIQQNRVSDFSQFYRQVDLLIVDDVQFFSGKEKTQEEFFHVFNQLHQNGKRIVLCADRPPHEIEGIEERLLSRFQWGLSADVQSPDLETRTAILQRKSQKTGLDLPHEVIQFIAERVRVNIRKLEGALLRLLAHASLESDTIDLATTRSVLSDLVDEPTRQVTIEYIKRGVAKTFRMDPELLADRTRKQEVVQARQIAMYYSRELTDKTLKSIGLQFGGRDHTTVIHAIKAVENKLETEDHFRQRVEGIRRDLANSAHVA